MQTNRPLNGRRSVSAPFFPSLKRPGWVRSDSTEPRDVSRDHQSNPAFDVPQTSPFKRRRTLGGLINSLPVEIMSEIFSWCTPTFDDQESSAPRSALALTHVCQKWRDVSISTPRLWTYTQLIVCDGNFEQPVELMKIWLERAKSLPIFIDVDFVSEAVSYGNALHLFEQLVSVGTAYRPIQSLADTALETHLEVSSGVFPTLEEWYFWTLGGITSKAVSLKMRALRIGFVSFSLEPYLCLSSSLTFLDLKELDNSVSLTVEDCAIILSHFPALIHCAMHVDYSDSTWTDLIVLQNLKSLSLSWGTLVDVGRLLDCLQTPILQELELSGLLPDTRSQRWHHLYNFLYRSQPPLTHIILEGIDCFYIRFLDCLSLCPMLTGLWMEECLLDDSIIDGMCGGGGILEIRSMRRGVMATLKHLAIMSSQNFTLDSLIAGLKAIKTNVGSLGLEKLHVLNCGHIRQEHMTILGALEIGEVQVGPVRFDTDMQIG